MPLKVIGAGVGRTGTHSLKIALEKLLGAPCYHMVEVFQHMEHVPMWAAAAKNDKVDWDALFAGYEAAVDWPASAFWPELSAKYPEALVILSTRNADAWWESAHSTIFQAAQRVSGPQMEEWLEMVKAVLGSRFTIDIDDKAKCLAAFEEHNAKVISSVDPKRLLVWQASEGWEPICRALNVPVPEEPFPLTNTKEEFLSRRAAESEEVHA